ncbi:MAG TPA: calcium/sodium antiporter [Acholeplasma sp.]|nr:calcium/sodium antiporter [Acholeplasma sp.]
MNLVLPIIILILGFVILVKGADLFVDGASKIARYFKVSTLIIGLTVVAFGTSLPEAAVSITSALKGIDDVAFGNVIGSNIFNMLPILGISAMVFPLAVNKDLLKRDFPIALLTVAMLIPMYYFIGDGNKITRLEGVFILMFFIVFLAILFMHAKKHPESSDILLSAGDTITEPASINLKKSSIVTLIGMIGIASGGMMVTEGAKTIAISLGMSEFLVGLTIVSIGTSLPELVTSIVASMKKESEIAIGNIVGSNIFNVLFILGLAATISGVKINAQAIYDIVFVVFVTVIVFLFAFTRKKISRLEGLFLCLIYLGYFAFIVSRDIGLL